MEEWKEYKARVFCSGVTDGTHDSPKPTNEGYYLITSKHLKDNLIDFSSANRISEEDYLKVITRSEVEQYDILFSMIGTIGNVVQVKLRNVDFAVKNMGIFKMDKNELKSSWLYYWLKSKYAKEYINQRLAGSTQSYLTLESLREFPLYYPGDRLAEQIISVLKSLDDKIEVNRQINDNFTLSFLLLTCFVLWLLKLRNDNLQQQAQTIFKSWFIDFEPFKDNGFVESELGYIPKGWRVGTLNEIADITMGMSPSGTSYNTEGQGDVFYQGRAEFGFRFPQRNLYTTEAKRFADVDSILVSVRAPVGDINVAEEKCCIGRGLASVRSKNKCNSFILYLLQSLKPIFNTFNGEGTVFGSINKKAFEEMPIIIPEESVIQSYESIALSIDSRIKSLEIESRRLAQLRDTLLPRLMSGELKVNEIEMP